jgi:hypothetical protein
MRMMVIELAAYIPQILAKQLAKQRKYADT